jgi:hypothetical protein
VRGTPLAIKPSAACTRGVVYFARVAYKKLGFSADATVAAPLASPPCTAAAPLAMTVSPGPTADSLKVSFPPSPDDGGCPVTSYKVEWDPAGALGFQAGAKAKESLLFGAREAQVVTVGARKAGELGGTFRAGLLDEASEPIPAGCPASALAAILADSLPSIGSVKVTRSEVRAGPSEGRATLRSTVGPTPSRSWA